MFCKVAASTVEPVLRGNPREPRRCSVDRGVGLIYSKNGNKILRLTDASVAYMRSASNRFHCNKIKDLRSIFFLNNSCAILHCSLLFSLINSRNQIFIVCRHVLISFSLDMRNKRSADFKYYFLCRNVV